MYHLLYSSFVTFVGYSSIPYLDIEAFTLFCCKCSVGEPPPSSPTGWYLTVQFITNESGATLFSAAAVQSRVISQVFVSRPPKFLVWTLGCCL